MAQKSFLIDGALAGQNGYVEMNQDVHLGGRIVFNDNTYIDSANALGGGSPSSISIGDLSDVDTTSIADGDVLVWDNAQSTFVATSGSGASVAGSEILTLTSASGTAGQVLQTDGAGNLSWTANGAYGDSDVASFLNGNLSTSIIPDTTTIYDLGSSTNRFGSLFVGAGETIHLGTSRIISDASGNVTFNGADDMVRDVTVRDLTVEDITASGNLTFSTASDIVNIDTLRINQTGTGLRMTNVGAFDNDGSDNFRVFATNSLQLRANGDTGTGIDIATSGAITFDGAYTFPTTDGSSSQVLTTDGSGNLSWSTVSGSGSEPATPTESGSVYAYTGNDSNANTGIGYNSLNETLTGARNVAIGYATGNGLTTGNYNTLIGSLAGNSLTSGTDNTIIGYRSAEDLTGDSNTVIGAWSANNLSTGNQNVIIGRSNANTLASGLANVIIGQEAGKNISSGASNNVVIGNGSAGRSINVSLSNGIAIGYRAYTGGVGGSNNVALGTFAGPTETDIANYNGSGSTWIGYGAHPTTQYGSNEFVCGGTNVDNFVVPGVGVTITPTTTELPGTVTATAFVGDGSGLTNLPSSGGASAIDDLTDVDTSTVAPSAGQALVWNGSVWAPTTLSGSGGISNPVDTYGTITVATNGTTSYFFDKNQLAQGPSSDFMHDWLAFASGNYTITQEQWNGTAWIADTLNLEIFAQKKANTQTVISQSEYDSGITKIRWTIDGSDCYYSYVSTLLIHMGWTSTAPNIDILFETSGDSGATWTETHSTTGLAWTSKTLCCPAPVTGTHGIYRLTLTLNNSTNLPLNGISLMTHRPGSQGRGPEFEFPYKWDGDRTIKFQNDIRFENDGRILAPAGEAGAPSLAFDVDGNTGLYWKTYNQIGFAADGLDAARLSANTFEMLGSYSTVEAGKIRARQGNDLSLSSTEHGLQIGPDSGSNIAMDNNEIMARNNGSASNLYMQNEGGDLVVGGSTNINGSQITINGNTVYHAGNLTPVDASSTGETDMQGDFRVRGNVEVNGDYYGDYGIYRRLVMNPNPEQDLSFSPYLVNDFAFFRQRGGTYTITNQTIYDGDFDKMFNAKASFCAFNTNGATAVDDATNPPPILELTLPQNMLYSSFVGVAFGAKWNRARGIRIEAHTGGAWVDCALENENGSDVVFARIPGNGSPGTDKLRVTLWNASSGDNWVRVTHIFGFDYDSPLATNLFIDRSGGNIYGDLDISGDLDVGGSLTVNGAAPAVHSTGTFTPEINVGTVSTAKGRWSRVGNQVTVNFLIKGFSDATSWSNIQINNMPFSGMNEELTSVGACTWSYINPGSGNTSIGCVMGQWNETKLFFRRLNTVGGGESALQHYYIDDTNAANAYIRGTITYITNDA